MNTHPTNLLAGGDHAPPASETTPTLDELAAIYDPRATTSWAGCTNCSGATWIRDWDATDPEFATAPCPTCNPWADTTAPTNHRARTDRKEPHR